MRGLGDGVRFNSHAVGEHFAMLCLERPFCANFLYLISFICFYILYCIFFYSNLNLVGTC
jgi:hypothetical protein